MAVARDKFDGHHQTETPYLALNNAGNLKIHNSKVNSSVAYAQPHALSHSLAAGRLADLTKRQIQNC